MRKTILLQQTEEVLCLDRSLSSSALCFQQLHRQLRRCQQAGALQPRANPRSRSHQAAQATQSIQHHLTSLKPGPQHQNRSKPASQRASLCQRGEHGTAWFGLRSDSSIRNTSGSAQPSFTLCRKAAERRPLTAPVAPRGQQAELHVPSSRVDA